MDENDKIISEAIKALGLGAVVPELYRDLLQPASRELGKNLLTVARTISIALAPLEGATWGYDNIKEWLAVKLTRKLSKVLPENIQTPPMVIAGPTLFELHFVKDERELKEMYANLLAAAMNSEIANNVHPSFVQILKQLSPDEAKILKYFSDNPEWYKECDEVTDGQNFPIEKSLTISDHFHEICKLSGAVNPNNSDTYLDNLLRLKILDTAFETDSQYIPEHGDRHGVYGPSVENKITRWLFTTPLGDQLIRTCVE